MEDIRKKKMMVIISIGMITATADQIYELIGWLHILNKAFNEGIDIDEIADQLIDALNDIGYFGSFDDYMSGIQRS